MARKTNPERTRAIRSYLALCCVQLSLISSGCETWSGFGAGGDGAGEDVSGDGFVIRIYQLPTDLGTIHKSPDKTSYAAGEIVTLQAEGGGFNIEFARWFGDATGCDDTVQVTVDKNLEIYAVFAELPPR